MTTQGIYGDDRLLRCLLWTVSCVACYRLCTQQGGRCGTVATRDVDIEAGPLPQFGHSLEPYLRQLGWETTSFLLYVYRFDVSFFLTAPRDISCSIASSPFPLSRLPCKLDKSVVKLERDFKLCTAGKALTSEQARLLKVSRCCSFFFIFFLHFFCSSPLWHASLQAFEIKMAKMHFVVDSLWTRGVFEQLIDDGNLQDMQDGDADGDGGEGERCRAFGGWAERGQSFSRLTVMTWMPHLRTMKMALMMLMREKRPWCPSQLLALQSQKRRGDGNEHECQFARAWRADYCAHNRGLPEDLGLALD
jgi:hypothetical protein